jgi:hypothetical protein
MNVLVVDIGGTGIKLWRTGESDKIRIPSENDLTPDRMVAQVRENLDDWKYDCVSIGFPGEVLNGRPKTEPYNLGDGWVHFDYPHAFETPVRMINDAAMQALGSYEGGRMLYIGLGTSMGTTLIAEGRIVTLALGHLRFCKGETFEHFLSRKGLELHGQKRWRRAVYDAAATLKAAFLADYVVLGGGNAKKLEELPEGCRRGGNENAYFGGLKMWEGEAVETGLKVVSAPESSEETDQPQAAEA